MQELRFQLTIAPAACTASDDPALSYPSMAGESRNGSATQWKARDGSATQ